MVKMKCDRVIDSKQTLDGALIIARPTAQSFKLNFAIFAS